MSEDRWLPVARAEEIAPRGARRLVTQHYDIAVFRSEDGRLFAIEDRCPHRGARLSAGAVYDNDKVACADHGWTVCLVDGKVAPPEQGRVRTFAVKVEDGVVYVLA